MDIDEELATYIAASAGLPRCTARRVVQDVLRHHRDGTEDFVRRRHRELQVDGWHNARIYDRIRRELATRLVRGPELSSRQVRRLIYG